MRISSTAQRRNRVSEQINRGAQMIIIRVTMSFYSAFAPFYSQIFPFREEVYLFLKKYAVLTECPLLDAGCGPGFYCDRFSRDGFTTVGVDFDWGMIDAATKTFSLPQFRCMDITGIGSLQGEFQMIYSIGNVLAHLSEEKLKLFIAAVYEKLASKGYWVFQVVNWDYLLTLQEFTFPVKSIQSGITEFRRAYPVISTQKAVFDVELITGGKTVFHEESILYPQCEAAYLQKHEAAGFITEGVYGGFDSTAFVNTVNSALVMVFRKP
jgi:2-polyprenyl-3-methyl-5-hydroxy-6-metoxy-1,4-benzoquinol methylase